ncbi:Nuclear factor of activated T-cells 5 [Paramuricea clavata]|uniref:Nuclear factor of activated T-cells 5 n=1 Tax=Paramuricea clavata TaxID=317549 RepID=A0A6S7FUH7_PARCT|nr:Nuclear factor of activated T-cells 5 [Paramuricea clavata]
MSEQIAFGESVSTQNEVEHDLLCFPNIDSPFSVDSGVATSPLSSSPSSPSSSISHEDRFPYIETFTDNSEPEQVQPKSSPSLPVEKTVKKLLELLVAAKTAGERSLISNLVTTLLTNSLKKDNSPPTSLASIKNVVEQRSRQGIKRPASSSSDETPRKELKTVLKTPAPVKPSIIMVEQPEQNYRARYESEGCRGPVHGSSDLTFPTFQIKGYNAPLWVTVYLATSNGTPHFHLLCGPGSTKLPCRDTTLPDGVTAIQVLVGPETDMRAVLDCISLKRRRNFEADKELRRRGLNPADWKSERKEACFVMTAEIPGSPSQTITCKSKVFQCTAPPGNPEIWWMRPVKGYVTGGEEIGIIGKKFLKGFQVRFYGELPNAFSMAISFTYVQCLPALKTNWIKKSRLWRWIRRMSPEKFSL